MENALNERFTLDRIGEQFKELLTVLKTDEVYSVAPFAKVQATLENAEAGFLDVWQRYQVKKHLKEAVETYGKKLQHTFDEEAWQAFKRIQLDRHTF